MMNSSNIYVSLKQLEKLKYQARYFSFTQQQPVNSVLSGKSSSRLRGRGLNFEELRHYRPGDDIRTLDWKVTQRTGKAHVKVFTEEKERKTYLAIDQRSSMFFGSRGKMKSVVAAEVAALIAWQINSSGDRIGAFMFNDQSIKVIPAKRGNLHVSQLLHQIVKLNHKLSCDIEHQENDVLNSMLYKLNALNQHNALIIIISDGYGWTPQTSSYVKTIRQHNEVIACRIYDELEQNLPSMPQMTISDGKWQIQFSSQNANTQQRFREEIERQLDQYREFTNKYRIPLITINTVEDPVHQLRRALGRVV
ncbi:DUF58 domain-containing protein [Thalassotalea mangrovi]|uniref:DUF58 domain-containing protein n=1 Tax=Thalassotalea mangrovi TaxID=2572245 RepID=A0A4U1B643_9GAMM|nr:DUF58 domain-containing protein [Thalassotalea mangrovi]TKB45886.1 DUF58 domain-containing protein [Thalassotalea mangrovi]